MVRQFFELRGAQLASVQDGGDAIGGCGGVSAKFTDSLAADVCLAGHEWSKAINQ